MSKKTIFDIIADNDEKDRFKLFSDDIDERFKAMVQIYEEHMEKEIEWKNAHEIPLSEEEQLYYRSPTLDQIRKTHELFRQCEKETTDEDSKRYNEE